MRAMQLHAPKGAFRLVERPLPEPGPRQVRIKVEACGICHSDSYVVEGMQFNRGITYPRVPGHEIAGHIDAIGPEVTSWRVGQCVGVGWHGGHRGVCANCRRGDFVPRVVGKVPGMAYDGGYAEFMIAPIEALAAIRRSRCDRGGAAAVRWHHHL